MIRTVWGRALRRPASGVYTNCFASIATVRDERTSSGLFQLHQLHQPSDFGQLTQQVTSKCHALRQKLDAEPAGVTTLQLLDEISNTICSVIDAAELCRNVHPRDDFRQAASKCFNELTDLILHVNGDFQLYSRLKELTQRPDIMSSFTEEQKRTAHLLQQEFERDGIHLPPHELAKVNDLQREIGDLGLDFQRNMYMSSETVEVPMDSLQGLPQNLLAVCKRKLLNPKMAVVPTEPAVINALLKYVPSEETRRKIYLAGNDCARANEEVLETLRMKRHELAEALGFPSYNHLSLSDRMIRDPDVVQQFLLDLSQRLQPQATKELELLSATKALKEPNASSTAQVWDLPYYMGLVKGETFGLHSRTLSSYFPLSSVLEGLQLVCSQVYDCQLVEVTPQASEVWHDDVKKLELQNASGDHLGTLYLDLYPRRNKYKHAAHFTIRCGKQVPSFDSSPSTYQRPIAALVCNFQKPAPDAPSLLTHSEVETLFHEFGHALHSLLSRTEFQHLSGTRAALDFVETPSHVMEYFAWDARFLRQFARHWQTQESIPTDLVASLQRSRRQFAALNAQTQCLYAASDLALFGSDRNDASTIIHDLHPEMTVVPYPHDDVYPRGADWHLRFGHLIGYGSGYYSYLYARVFAAEIWSSNFAPDSHVPEHAGAHVRDELLVHGGAKDPKDMLVKVIGRVPTSSSFLNELGIE